MYANRSFSGMFELENYDSMTDPYNYQLHQKLKTTELQRLGKEDDSYQTTAWNFLDHAEKGAPFSFNIDADAMQEDNPEM